VWREALRFLHQRERFVSRWRPLVWLFIFAAASARCSASPSSRHTRPTSFTEVYIAPGLMAMIQLFNGMQSSLSMVLRPRDGQHAAPAGEPLPRGYLLFCKLLAGTAGLAAAGLLPSC